METLCPSSYFSNLNLFTQERNSSTEWTKEENKIFERALAIYDEKTPERWLKVANMTGRSVSDVKRQYMELESDVCDIEAGLVPIPGYSTPSFTLEMVGYKEFDEFRKRPLARGSSDHERKKGVPWTEDEHRRFLMGLEKYGKGDWRNISRNYVNSKTPTQVASHAQKYFIRQNSDGKDKKRPSIHDITTVHLTDTVSLNNDEGLPLDLFEPALQKSESMPKMLLNLKRSNSGEVMIFGSNHGLNHPLFQIQATRQQIYG